MLEYFKTYLLLFFVLLNITLIAKDKRVLFGLQTNLTGVRLFNITSNDSSKVILKNNIMPSYDFGASVQIKHFATFYSKYELLYSVKGAKDTYLKYQEFNQKCLKLHYIELPITINYKFQNNITCGLGASANYKFSDNAKGIRFADKLHWFDISAIANCGYSFGKMQITVFYKNGLIPIIRILSTNLHDKSTKTPQYEVLEPYNQSFGIGIFYKLF